MFYHGFNGYLRHAFPSDELTPLTGAGRGLNHTARFFDGLHRQRLIAKDGAHEILGGFALTLIDAMDTLVILGDVQGFHQACRLVIELVPNFNIDNDVLVFEMNIRVLGGLLSAHLFLKGAFEVPEVECFRLSSYKDELLLLALDLGQRLLPAFQNSPTGIPYSRLNLRHGLPQRPASTNCPAAAGTFILEFGLLSTLTGNAAFYTVAKEAVWQLWRRRSALDLLGYEIDVVTGKWTHPASTIGAGTDSFFEYLLKGYVMFGDPDLLEIYKQASRALKRHLGDEYGVFLRVTHYETGGTKLGRLDALGAFMPSLMVLHGDVKAAQRLFHGYRAIARRHGNLLPEAFDLDERATLESSYNLRPELVESALLLWQATKDATYQSYAIDLINAIDSRCRTPFGFAVLQDLQTGLQGDRMESFLLSETLKYAFLLLAEPEHWAHRLDGPVVFSTEAHLLRVPRGTGPIWSETLFYRCNALNELGGRERSRLGLITAWLAGGGQAVDYQPKGPGSQWVWSSPKLSDNTHERISIDHMLCLFRGVFGRFKRLKVAPWPDPADPGFLAIRADETQISGGEPFFLVMSRPSQPGEFVAVARIAEKEYPIHVTSPGELREFSLCRSLKGRDPFGPSMTLWVASPMVWRRACLQNLPSQIALSHKRVRPIDLLALFRRADKDEPVPFYGVPIRNVRLLTIPDFVLDLMQQK